MNKQVEISYKSIVFAVLFPLFLWFLWINQELLFSLLIAFILMSALRPIAEWLVAHKFPRTAAIFTVFFGFIIFFTGLVSLIIPPIVLETTNFIRNLPAIVQDVNPEIRQYVDLNSISQYVPTVTNNIFGVIGGLFSNFIFILTTLFFTLYFLMERDLVRKALKPFFHPKEVEQYAKIAEQVEVRLTAWFWGQISLMFLIGLVTYIVLTLLGIRYALPLAVLSGLLEIVPNLGPILATFPAALVGFSSSVVTGVAVVAVYFIIQQLENAVIVPQIMRRAVGVNPIMTLISLLIGGKIGGVLGVLLSIPILLIIQTIISEVWKHRKHSRE